MIIDIILYERTVFYFVKRKTLAIRYDENHYAIFTNSVLTLVSDAEIQKTDIISTNTISLTKVKYKLSKALLKEYVEKKTFFESEARFLKEYMDKLNKI
ncbi:MAG: hypothetical protein WC973_03545 [Candidatus Dojkabacteria bacterium]